MGLLFASTYSTIDCGITQTYHDASEELSTKMLQQSVVIANMNVIGKPLSEVQKLLPKDVDGLEPFIKENEGCFYAGQVCIKYDQKKKVVGVSISEP